MSNVLWMPSALEDLKGIQEYISRDSVYYADKLVDEVFDATEKLELFPEMGRIVSELGIPTVREIFYGSYRIIYELIDDNAHIIAVIHGKRLLPDISDNLQQDKSDDG